MDYTSFDVVAKMRGMAKTKKIGHGGTLDPIATGVLPIFIGRATKAIELAPCHDKSYQAEVRFGLTTDTLDRCGSILTTQTPRFTLQALQQALQSFRGDILQTPPMYSAVKVGGERLYQAARRGETVERPKRKVHIYKLELMDFNEMEYTCTLQVDCSKGTYIRTLCDDLGRILGCGAILQQLRRTSALGFSFANCYTMEKLQQLCNEGILEKSLLPIESLFTTLPKIQLSTHLARLFCNGVQLGFAQIEAEKRPGYFAVYGDMFLGIGYFDFETEKFKSKKLFVAG